MASSKKNPAYRDRYGERVAEIMGAMDAAVPPDATLSHVVTAAGMLLFSRLGIEMATAAEFDEASDQVLAALQGTALTIRDYLTSKGMLTSCRSDDTTT